MAAGLSQWVQPLIMDYVFRGSATGFSASHNLKLYTASPNWQTGSGGTEQANGNGYTTGGNSVTRNQTNWPAAADHSNGVEISNAQTASFSWSASGNWASPPVVGAGLWDSTNLVAGADLTSSLTVYSGDTIRFAAGAFRVNIDHDTAAGLSKFIKKKMLDNIFGAVAYTPGATWQCALYTSAPSFPECTGGTEASGGGYARLNFGQGTGNWKAAADDGSGHITKNNAQAAWGPTSSPGYGNIVALVVWESTNAILGNSHTSTAVNTGDTATYAVDAITAKLNNSGGT